MRPNARRLSAWTMTAIALACFGAGALTTACLTKTEVVQADSDRVFELRIYHTVPGKLPVMESRFRETTSKILARHNLNVLGYWTGENAPGSENTFVFLLAHRSREEAKQNWAAAAKDPEFQPVIKAEQGEKTLDKADVLFLRPTDFSTLK